jgi:hypothetical protein
VYIWKKCINFDIFSLSFNSPWSFCTKTVFTSPPSTTPYQERKSKTGILVENRQSSLCHYGINHDSQHRSNIALFKLLLRKQLSSIRKSLYWEEPSIFILHQRAFYLCGFMFFLCYTFHLGINLFYEKYLSIINTWCKYQKRKHGQQLQTKIKTNYLSCEKASISQNFQKWRNACFVTAIAVYCYLMSCMRHQIWY